MLTHSSVRFGFYILAFELYSALCVSHEENSHFYALHQEKSGLQEEPEGSKNPGTHLQTQYHQRACQGKPWSSKKTISLHGGTNWSRAIHWCYQGLLQSQEEFLVCSCSLEHFVFPQRGKCVQQHLQGAPSVPAEVASAEITITTNYYYVLLFF